MATLEEEHLQCCTVQEGTERLPPSPSATTRRRKHGRSNGFRRARDAESQGRAAGDKLGFSVRGPKRAEAVVKLLAQRKGGSARRAFAVDHWRAVVAQSALARPKAVQWTIGDRNSGSGQAAFLGDSENQWHYQHGKRWPSLAVRRLRRAARRLAGAKSCRRKRDDVHFKPMATA